MPSLKRGFTFIQKDQNKDEINSTESNGKENGLVSPRFNNSIPNVTFDPTDDDYRFNESQRKGIQKESSEKSLPTQGFNSRQQEFLRKFEE